MKTMKKFIFISSFVFFCFILYVDTYASNVRLIIDNQEISGLPSPPVIRNDSVLVPARAVFERMGGIVGWHSGNRQVTVYHGSDVLVMTINDTTAILNGRPVRMPTPPIIIGNSTMIPLRFPGEAFGFFVDWDRENRAAIINSPIPTIPPHEAPPPEGPPINPPIENHPPSEDSPTESTVDDEQNSPWHITPDDDKLDLAPPGSGLIPPPSESTNLARNVSPSPILTATHPQTNITQILSPAEVGIGAYVILASSPISEVSYFILYDNRIVVDIHNAVNMVSGSIPAHSSVPVSEVRAAQHSTSPMVTRIVFHVTQATEFKLYLSENRESLTVAFTANSIRNISFQSDGILDTLSIQGDFLPCIRISTEGFPNFLTINIDNAGMLTSGPPNVNGTFATHFATGQRADGSAYIRVYVGDSWPTFSADTHGNTITLTLHYNITGVRYDSLRRELHISRSTGFAMDISQVQHTNEYLHLRYTLTLPSSASMLGRGEIGIMDGFINTVYLRQNLSGNAQLVFDTTRILGFTVHQTPDAYIIRAHLPADIHPFIVVLDPGHGGSNIGTAHHGVVERVLALTIAEKVMQLLDNNPNIQGYMTRWDDSTVYNLRRAEFANEIGADLLISIHANAAGTRENPNPAPHGIETWYNFGERERSNNNHFTSRQFAEIIQRHKITRTGANCRGLRYGAGLIVPRESNMPAVLLELGFLTNPAEAARLATSQHQWLLAHAIYDAIVEAANTFPRP